MSETDINQQDFVEEYFRDLWEQAKLGKRVELKERISENIQKYFADANKEFYNNQLKNLRSFRDLRTNRDFFENDEEFNIWLQSLSKLNGKSAGKNKKSVLKLLQGMVALKERMRTSQNTNLVEGNKEGEPVPVPGPVGRPRKKQKNSDGAAVPSAGTTSSENASALITTDQHSTPQAGSSNNTQTGGKRKRGFYEEEIKKLDERKQSLDNTAKLIQSGNNLLSSLFQITSNPGSFKKPQKYVGIPQIDFKDFESRIDTGLDKGFTAYDKINAEHESDIKQIENSYKAMSEGLLRVISATEQSRSAYQNLFRTDSTDYTKIKEINDNLSLIKTRLTTPN